LWINDYPMKNYLAAVLALGGVVSSPAEVIWQTYDGITLGGEILQVSRTVGYGGDRKAGWFTTDANPYLLDSVMISLRRQFGNSSDMAVSVCMDAGGRPGASIGALVGPSEIGGSSFSNYAFTASDLRLEASSTYWLVMEPSLFSLSYFQVGTSPDAMGYLSAPIHAATGTYWESWQMETEFHSPAFTVSATVVPEPGAFVLWIGGAGALWLWKRRGGCVRAGGRASN